jgi:hypothetical protein
MSKTRVIALAAACWGAQAALAQPLPVELSPGQIAPRPLQVEVLQLASREPGAEAVVKGAPYCATAVHESVQPLLDGNRIVRRHTSQLCRDGEGRTRHEVQPEGGAKRIYLRDPIARESWLLDPERKTARHFALAMDAEQRARSAEQASSQAERQRHLADLQRAAADGWREQSERWRDWALEVARRARESATAGESRVRVLRPATGGAEPGVVVESEVRVRNPAGPDERHREVRVIRLNDLPALSSTAPLPPAPPLPPLPTLSLLAAAPGLGFNLGHFEPRGAAVKTALPAKEIEGVKVDGERSSWTIEAGKLGNEKPIVITREVWRSPELMLVLHSRDVDPRSGEVNYRLENIKRGEPDAALMKVPADYQQPVRKAPAAKS